MRKPLAIKQCALCGKDIEIYHKERLNRDKVFCCKKCEGEYRCNLTTNNAVCYYCGKEFHIKPSHIIDGHTGKRKNHLYCSNECRYNSYKILYSGVGNHQYGLKGDRNASWKSDEKITSYGYKKIRILDHPFRDCDGFVFEHRLVAEKYLLTDENSIEIEGKFYLKKEYVVHHIDGNKLNNNVNNLKIMTINEHTALHHKLRNK